MTTSLKSTEFTVPGRKRFPPEAFNPGKFRLPVLVI